jgi:hypothetical protein
MPHAGIGTPFSAVHIALFFVSELLKNISKPAKQLTLTRWCLQIKIVNTAQPILRRRAIPDTFLHCIDSQKCIKVLIDYSLFFRTHFNLKVSFEYDQKCPMRYLISVGKVKYSTVCMWGIPVWWGSAAGVGGTSASGTAHKTPGSTWKMYRLSPNLHKKLYTVGSGSGTASASVLTL